MNWGEQDVLEDHDPFDEEDLFPDDIPPEEWGVTDDNWAAGTLDPNT